jgi:hypothetical protein
MARAFNLPSEGARTSEVGLFWYEIKSGGGLTSFEVNKHHAIRIRSTTAGLTVQFDDLLSATMDAGEIMIFNSGGRPNNETAPAAKNTVTLAVSGACYIQVGLEQNRDDP